MESFLTHLIVLLIGLAGGGYLGYKYGARVIKDEQAVEGAVKKL